MEGKSVLMVALLLLAGSGLAGCVGEEALGAASKEVEEFRVRFKNDGESTMPVKLKVTGPGGKSVFDDVVRATGGKTTEKVVPVEGAGQYVFKATYSAESARGTRSVEDSRTHTLETDECQTEAVTLTFRFTYTSSGSSQSWGNNGSSAVCGD